MKQKLMILIVGLGPMLLCNCASTVADHVPSARGTATGQIRVDGLTAVSTSSRIVVVAPSCAPSRSSAMTGTWATSPEGIVVTTNRMSRAEGFHHIAGGVGELTQGAGVAAIGVGAIKGKLGTRVSTSSQASVEESCQTQPTCWY